MKIIQVTASISQDDGGPSTSIKALNREFLRMGHDAVIITSDSLGPSDGFQVRLGAPVEVDGCQVIFHHTSKYAPYKYARTMRRTLERELATADCVLVDGLYLPSTVTAFRAARRAETPFILQPHGTLDVYDRRKNSWIKSVFDLWIGRRIYSSSAAIVVTSDLERVDALPSNQTFPIAVIPLGASLEASQAVDNVDRWLAVPREARFVFLGRLARKKRPDLLIRSWALSNSKVKGQLLVVGPDHEFTRQELESLADELGVSESVTFLGGIGQREAAYVLRSAGVFVLPTERENFGIALAEAMMAGCAILTTDEAALSRTVNSAGAGLVLSSANTETLARALDELIGEPAAVSEMGRAGGVAANRDLTWRASAEQFIELIESVGVKNG
ncbi:glycosyltransferase [Cryobacterium soli]|uniref:glycosyltransferase n=1 Tax=Cryobacterium soli TaxID=2220095 RepID=UPI0013C485FB|nr:glycosyltransferase [Cryobacterium soli]